MSISHRGLINNHICSGSGGWLPACLLQLILFHLHLINIPLINICNHTASATNKCEIDGRNKINGVPPTVSFPLYFRFQSIEDIIKGERVN